MAHVLNKQERNYAFWKFLFFFLLSTALIVSAVYFDVYVPNRENGIMSEQVKRYKRQAKEQQKFLKGIEVVNGLFDSLTSNEASAESRIYITQDITGKIKDLRDLQDEDSSMYSGLNRKFSAVYMKYLTATNKVIGIAELQRKLDECQINKEKAERELEKAKDDLDACKRASASATNPNW